MAWERLFVTGFVLGRTRRGDLFLWTHAVDQAGDERTWAAFQAEWFPFDGGPEGPPVWGFTNETPLLLACLAAATDDRAAQAVAAYRAAVGDGDAVTGVSLRRRMAGWAHRRVVALREAGTAEDVSDVVRAMNEKLGGRPVVVDWRPPERLGGWAGPADHALPFLPGGPVRIDEKFGRFRAATHLKRFGQRPDRSLDGRVLESQRRLAEMAQEIGILPAGVGTPSAVFGDSG